MKDSRFPEFDYSQETDTWYFRGEELEKDSKTNIPYVTHVLRTCVLGYLELPGSSDLHWLFSVSVLVRPYMKSHYKLWRIKLVNYDQKKNRKVGDRYSYIQMERYDTNFEEIQIDVCNVVKILDGKR